MKKLYMLAVMVFLCLLSANTIFASNITAQSSVQFITESDANSYTLNTIPTKGTLPFVKSGTTNSYQINSEIQKIRDAAVNDAKKDKALSIDFRYDVKRGGLDSEYISIIIYSSITSASTLERVDTIVIDADTHKILNLTDVLGANGVKIANIALTNKISSNYSQYSNSTAVIDENQSFYVDNNILYLAFDKYEIAAGSYGIQTVDLKLENIVNLVLAPDEYTLSGLYGTRMVPLRQVCEAFDFQIASWNQSTQTATITKPGVSGSARVIIGKNSYNKWNNSNTEVSQALETAPEIINNSVYVPITFTEIILDLSYSVDSSGNITISNYIHN